MIISLGQQGRRRDHHVGRLRDRDAAGHERADGAPLAAWYTAAAVNSSFLIFDLGARSSLRRCSPSRHEPDERRDLPPARLGDPDGVTAPVYDSGRCGRREDRLRRDTRRSPARRAARYWRLDLTDASLTHLQIGRVFLGPSWTHQQTLVYGWGVTPVDPSRHEVARRAELPGRAAEVPRCSTSRSTS
jgi:hypothetical protein